METSRYIISLSYLGTQFSGWQIQDNANTVQGLIMDALHTCLDKKISLIVGAGRTDTGVHAVNFIAHFDYRGIVNNMDLTYKLNRFLSMDIAIHFIIPISNNFHARFSAISRRYEYVISTVKDPFFINRAYFFYKTINLELMNEGAALLIGENDFSAFAKAHPKNPVCYVKSACWTRKKHLLVFSIESNRFLYNMVRCVVGTLIDLGVGKIDLCQFKAIYNSRNRSESGVSVPAEGLCLVSIKYPKMYNLEII